MYMSRPASSFTLQEHILTKGTFSTMDPVEFPFSRQTLGTYLGLMPAPSTCSTSKPMGRYCRRIHPTIRLLLLRANTALISIGGVQFAQIGRAWCWCGGC